MSKHEKSISHLTSTAKLNAYKINRNYVKILIDFTLYLARQGIPFRGHDKRKESFKLR